MRYNLLIVGLLLYSILYLWNILYSCTTVPEPVTTGEENRDDNNDNHPSSSTETNKAEEPDEYSQTDVEYNAILNEIEIVIEQLNRIIRNREYQIWLTYLTEEYKEKKGNTAYLKELSENPVIKNQNIVLRSLKDYFFYVVVPSRYNVKLDKISIIDKNHVKAYMYMNNEFIILYYLEKQDDEWKIGSW